MASSRRGWLGLVLSSALTGCATYPDWLPSGGPSAEQVTAGKGEERELAVPVLQIDAAASGRVQNSQRPSLFSELDEAAGTAERLASGDVVEVSIWEAPPAVLFSSGIADARLASGASRVTTLPAQMINSAGAINVPFAGAVDARGRLPQELEQEIKRRLKGKANQPEVMVRTVGDGVASVTVVGDVTRSLRMPLTARRERLLDALAGAGGTRQPVGKTMLQLTRGAQVRAMPLDDIIRDPRQNIPLREGDVVTALHQPLSFTALGATGKNEEVSFEAQGISLAQALGRVGGLSDSRADAGGVFIFRFELPQALEPDLAARSPRTADGRIPVIYRADLKAPGTFFVAQTFPLRDKDVVYVANSPVAEWQKFLNVLASVVYPIYTIQQLRSN